MKKEFEKHTIVGKKGVLDTLQTIPDMVDVVCIESGKQGQDFRRIFDICKKERIQLKKVNRTVLDRMYQGNHQGVALRLYKHGFTDEETLLQYVLEHAYYKLILAFDQIQDPGNIGTTARTLAALGGGGILIPKHNTAYLGSGAEKSSAGALAHLQTAKVTNLSKSLEKANEFGFHIYGAHLSEDSKDVYRTQMCTPAVLVLGSEEKGIRPGVAKRCTNLVHVPMPGKIESMNVAQAGAIVIGELFRQTHYVKS